VAKYLTVLQVGGKYTALGNVLALSFPEDTREENHLKTASRLSSLLI
jgi:hypothetical protein